jgi:hypothetical protein
MTLPNWTPPMTKMRVFEAFYLLNRSFEATIHAVEQVQRLEFFQDADLPALQNRLECLRSETNEVLIENMLDHEHDEAFRFDQLVRQWEKANRDPNELFFRAEENKEELREQLEEIQEALARQGPDRRQSKRRAAERQAAEERPARQKARKPKAAKRKSSEKTE